jgi:hypothetical protein
LLALLVATSSAFVLGGTSQGVLVGSPVSRGALFASSSQLKVINHSPSLVPDAVQTGNCHVVHYFEKGVQPWLSDS